MKRKQFTIIACLTFFILTSSFAIAQRNPDREYYKLTIYHFKDSIQEEMIDTYLEYALLPALHRQTQPILIKKRNKAAGIFCLSAETLVKVEPG